MATGDASPWYTVRTVASKDAVLETLREVVAPLVEIDGGELYLVTVDGEDVKVHLAGACAGCPGATLTTRGVVEPALRAGNPHVRVTVSAGVTVPPGATRIEPQRRA